MLWEKNSKMLIAVTGPQFTILLFLLLYMFEMLIIKSEK